MVGRQRKSSIQHTTTGIYGKAEIVSRSRSGNLIRSSDFNYSLWCSFQCLRDIVCRVWINLKEDRAFRVVVSTNFTIWFSNLQRCRKKLVKWKKNLRFSLILNCTWYDEFFLIFVRISRYSKIRQNYHCGAHTVNVHLKLPMKLKVSCACLKIL